MTSGARLERAFLLLSQGRTALAEREARAALATDPDDAQAHAVLALALLGREQHREAEEAARQAIALAPDLALAHYALGAVRLGQGRLKDAEAPCAEALRLERDAVHHWLLGRLRLAQSRWAEALEQADRGLALDPEHGGCLDLRATALIQLGRHDEAEATLQGALERDPEDASAHTNRGWLRLHRADPQGALASFREALRLDPTNERARAGIVEALKARHGPYRLFLRYCLWMSRLGTGKGWLLIIGAYLAYRVLLGVARSNPALAPWLHPLLGAYLVFVLFTWTADDLGLLLLRLHPLGRLSLSRGERIGSLLFGACLLAAALLGGVWWLSGVGAAGRLALVCALLVLPLTAARRQRPGWGRWLLGGAAVSVLLAGLLAAACFLAGGDADPPDPLLRGLGSLAFFGAVLGAVLSTWLLPLVALATRPR